ncbi:hypothetical protein [Microbacterium sp. JZ31]|uniref:hypothetical protein n=1 Tax=Microbacterium sp. JZ31 TaxID=1906274 RepID=UPI0019317F79|nr:hypothetical protein [Microbacterium sp. JZ31]
MRTALRRAAAAIATATLVLGLAACVPEPSAGEARRDPAPSFADARTTQVDRDGDQWKTADVTVDVPEGAVTTNVANVTVGAPIASADSGIAGEVFGTPVRLDTPVAFGAPVTLSWDMSEVPAEAATAAALVRWDDDRRVWVPEPGAPAVADGALSVQMSGSGIVTWATAAIADPAAPPVEPVAPRCEDAALPDWVGTAADPDLARPESAVLSCFEAHQSDVLTIRTRSREATSRALELTGDAAFAWVTRDDAGERFWRIAAGLVDDEATALLPPGAGVDVGLSAGEPALRAVARVDTRTATVDLLAAFARHVSLGEVPDPSVTGLISDLYGCGAAQTRPLEDAATVSELGTALTACAAELTQPPAITPDAEPAQVQGARAVAAALRIGAAGAFDTLAASSAEALVAAAAAPPGGASWTVLAGGEAPAPGSWAATCTDVEADAAALFAVLAAQPPFRSPTEDLATTPAWRDAAAAAVAPLAECTPDERARFASRLPDEWADPDAAHVVVDAIAGLGLSLLTCDDLFALAAPLAKGFHELRGITASSSSRVACGWAAEKGKSITDRGVTSRVEVWVSRENADADEVARRRTEAEKTELGGVQKSDALDAVAGYAVGAYVPTGLELESWLPGYRIAVTTTSSNDPAQWRMPAGIAAIENIAEALTTG